MDYFFNLKLSYYFIKYFLLIYYPVNLNSHISIINNYFKNKYILFKYLLYYKIKIFFNKTKELAFIYALNNKIYNF